ncbi:MAG: hypothetical protein A2277_15340 [Desulfobacterales bacterium RIFOXYA12_FULL_46_15]|nr:MAG: hypothetical protein A2277_15340 [Desulfobacterales bacterium RIFOXYA12_FULL_46_15]
MAMEGLEKKADMIRKRLVEVSIQNGAGHIAPSLSCVDILTYLYYQEMNINKDPEWEGRDRLIFSKAHGAYGLYAILSDIGYIDSKDWEDFYNGSFLKGCIERSPAHGIEAGCGALGHGLPMAAGVAFGARLQSLPYRTICIAGDGEMQEGSNWEAIQFAAKYKLKNLIIIVDCNGLQAMDTLSDVLSPEDFYKDLMGKFSAFGCEVILCNGHCMEELQQAFRAAQEPLLQKPKAILARTVKGYGIKAMENVTKFHFRVPTKEEMAKGVRYE